jgi:DNA-binding transcriptional ArsR family regulator
MRNGVIGIIMPEYIHWWQFPLNLVSFKLKPTFKEKFFKEAKKKFKSVQHIALFLQQKSKLYNKRITTDYRIIWYYQKKAEYIPAWVVYEISRKIKMSLLKIEKNIEGYVSTYGRLYIPKPKLPIKITPEFVSLAIHGMCDGCVNKNHFAYFQKEKFGLERIERLFSNVFGEYKIKKYKRTHYFPTIFSTIITNYFDIRTYCRIPHKILKGSKENRIATLMAVLHDEGNVSGRVRFFSSNKEFLMDLAAIAKSLGYEYTISLIKQKGKMKKDAYCLSLRYNSVKKFANDCDKLVSKFPDLYPGRKLDEIKNIIKFNRRSWRQRKKFETKKLILKALDKGAKTAFELREIVGINLWTVYHHLQQLIEEGIIEKKKEGRQFKFQLSTINNFNNHLPLPGSIVKIHKDQTLPLAQN